jgi:hypothetical protein
MLNCWRVDFIYPSYLCSNTRTKVPPLQPHSPAYIYPVLHTSMSILHPLGSIRDHNEMPFFPAFFPLSDPPLSLTGSAYKFSRGRLLLSTILRGGEQWRPYELRSLSSSSSLTCPLGPAIVQPPINWRPGFLRRCPSCFPWIAPPLSSSLPDPCAQCVRTVPYSVCRLPSDQRQLDPGRRIEKSTSSSQP